MKSFFRSISWTTTIESLMFTGQAIWYTTVISSGFDEVFLQVHKTNEKITTTVNIVKIRMGALYTRKDILQEKIFRNYCTVMRFSIMFEEVMSIWQICGKKILKKRDYEIITAIISAFEDLVNSDIYVLFYTLKTCIIPWLLL